MLPDSSLKLSGSVISRREWAVLLAALGVFALLRFAGSNTQMLSRDEGFSWRMSQYSPGDLLRHMPGGANPPLYYFLLKGWTAVFGVSPVALRSLSALFSVAALGVLYLLCRELVGRGGAWFGVCAAGLHAGQVAVAPVARMYGLGVFLAALTAWLLVRALRANAWRSPWWSAYGLAVAAFCYAHYFAFFAVFAQTLFVIGDLFWRGRAGKSREVVPSAAGFLYAGCLALLLYAPWLPVFRSQARDVQEDFWIAALTAEELRRLVFSWLTGMEYEDGPELWAFLLVFAVAMLATAACGGRWARFFLLQAIIPWLAVVGMALGGRTIAQERYFVFGQIALFGLCALAWHLFSRRKTRMLLLAFAGPLLISGLVEHLRGLPDRGPAMQAAAEWLRDQDADADLFVIDDYRYVNLFRYYTARAGLPWLTVKARAPSVTGKGHIVHLGALENSDLYWSAEELGRHAPARVWLIGVQGGLPTSPMPGQRSVWQREFWGGGATCCIVARSEPE